ncbi:GTPase HflX [Clostridium sp. HCP1S3_B4]|uniref:GTPase HflX n=1 Tax=unclassified Clostridium TaxID=2614128 RepID=UPI0016A35468|nr:GTPase HflX [Clostridiales bacterium]MDY2729348.1 GTPase HflX [Clostridium sp.]NLK23647.1 GTPase HflX [Clostridiales bacterium]
MINGNIDGIKKCFIEALDEIYKIRTNKDELASRDIINIITRVSSDIQKEVSVAIDRKGKVTSVSIGDSTSVELPILDVREQRLSGIRIIHTHPNGYSNLSAMDLSALLKLKLDAIVAVGIYEGKIIDISIGTLMVSNNVLITEESSKMSLDKMMSINFLEKVSFIDTLIKNNDVIEDTSEKAILVGSDTKESLEELEELAKACNIPVLEKVYQSRSKIDPAFFIGKGKVLQIAALRQTEKANLIIFDDELSGSQVRNLENAIGAKVIDRTTLILEIFAKRAKSREAKIQVELAQLKYRKSRLQGLGLVLSRTGGGIGTKGPGEKKLETDRRRIDDNIYDLNKELKKIKKIREVQRGKRTKSNIPRVALVGYTNAGKSTLRNTLCDVVPSDLSQGKEKVFEADMLFATLDITTRAIKLKSKGVATVTDTVGFVRKLPHDLVEAFKSTLEEVVEADLLCHVVDASSEDSIDQIRAVNTVLEEIGAKDKETLLVLNKIDKASNDQLQNIKDAANDEKIIEISAKQKLNLNELLEIIEENLPYKFIKGKFLVPYTNGDIVSLFHRNGRVISEEYRDNGTFIEVELDEENYNRAKQYLIE